jgi:hypothetical protein
MPGTPAEDVLTSKLTDEVLARALTDAVLASVPAGPSQAVRKPGRHRAALIPAGHGLAGRVLAAVATFALAVVTAAGTR